MWPRTLTYDRLIMQSSLLLLLLSLLLMQQHHVMASQASAAAMVQLKNHQQQQQQHQTSKTLGQPKQQQKQQHHVQSQLTQQHHQHQQQQQQKDLPGIVTHPDGISDSNAGHHISIEKQTLHSATSLPSTSSLASSAAHLPAAQFVNDKESATTDQDVFKHFNNDDDMTDSYQILNELKRETNVNNLLSAPPPPPILPFSINNYPWNVFERNPYASAAFNSIPVPPISGIFPHMFGAFDGYPTPFPVTPRFMPIMSYPQPILVPYPFYMTPEMYYPGFSGLSAGGLNDYEDAMSRGTSANRRPSVGQHSAPGYSRNSPIYYVRLPPTPYMFMPSLGLGATTPAMTGFPTIMPYQSMPTFPSFSSIFNVPINFLANGKPSNIYQIGGSPNDIQGAMQYPGLSNNLNFNTRPSATQSLSSISSASLGPFRPSLSSQNYINNNNNIPTSSSSSSSSSSHSYGSNYAAAQNSASTLQDSKLTSLKRPYFFNGRPEDIYILPNNFNALYSSENSFY